MTNDEFLQVIKKSFGVYLDVRTSRSTAKLKPLHGSIAKDLQQKFGSEFTVHSQGFGDDKEHKIDGRYYSKNVDLTVERNGIPVAGYAVKFVVRNYAQNSNNYFVNMLGETANIRTGGVPYFQIFIAFEKTPYFDKDRKFKKYDVLSDHNIKSILRYQMTMLMHTTIHLIKHYLF